MSPSRRREAVLMLQARLSVSERRACLITGQHCSTQRHRPRRRDRDDGLRARLRELSREYPRWGYRRAWASLRHEGWPANRKKIQRLWREEGLRVPARRRKRRRLGTSTIPAARLRAERPNQLWALDFQLDTTSDGRLLKLLHVVDEQTRQALAIQVERRIDTTQDGRILKLLRVVDEYTREALALEVDERRGRAADAWWEHDTATVVLALYDFDAGGQRAARSVERGLREHAPGVPVEFRLLALTDEQIEEWQLPTRPPKTTDPEAKKWGARGAVELDAIPPDLLTGLVGDAILDYVDAEAWEHEQVYERSERELLAKITAGAET